MNNYVAVIQAGGKGTRMSKLTEDKIPKPLLKLNGNPMIEWQLDSLKSYGIKDFIIIVGHLGCLIEDYFGDGSKWDINISYIEEKKPLGSAGSLFYVKELVKNKNIILIFGDVMFELDWNRFISFHETKGGTVTLLAHPNAHPYDSDLLNISEDYKVIGIDSKNNKRDYYYKNCVNAGLTIFNYNLLESISAPQKLDFESDLVKSLIDKGEVYAYCTPEYVKDAGTPERYELACLEQENGIWSKKCLSNKQKAIFLDRDGTINKYVGFLTDINQFELIDGVAEAIKKINESGYLAIVVTNQPVIARGEVTFDELNEIHNKMETLLGEQGAYLDGIYYCPHHPHSGYEGEVKELKIECDCRKPKLGMLFQASKDFNIDLEESWMIGDTTVDVQTGINGGLQTVLLKTGEAGNDKKYNVIANYECDDLLDAIEMILNKG